jgi:hypothetical protein
MDQPAWFKQLQWSAPMHIMALNQDRRVIPDFTGCYVFTEGPVPIAPGRVLYVGEAAGQPLRSRLPVYLVDFQQANAGNLNDPASTGGKRAHKGKGFILEAREKRGDAGVYVSWVEYGASPDDIHILEASLINYLNPGANDRIEEYRHPTLGDHERLNRHLIR